MNAVSLALIITGVLCNAAAQLFLKAGGNVLGVISFTRDAWLDTALKIGMQPYYWGGFVCYAVSIVVWIMALSRVPVSVAYPMLSIGYIVNALAAWYLFGEALTMVKWLGIGFIIIGVWLVAKNA
jgi:multidrug transporter EmrE-like cation transporter